MSRLILLRHARAAWPSPGMKDFDRPLEEGADAEAEAIGLAMRANGHLPKKVLCSSARRTRETWAHVARGLEVDASAAEFTDALYCADASGYMDIVRANSGEESLLIIGHNPMIEDVAFSLSKGSNTPYCTVMEGGFAACGLAVIEFPGPLGEADTGKGCLRLFMTPDDL